MNMTNYKNLKPFQKGQRSRDEVVETSRKGGIRSGEVRREQKSIKAYIKLALETEVTDKKSGKKVVVKDAIGQKIVSEALKGNLKAFEMILKIIGEAPVTKLEVTGANGESLIPQQNMTIDEAKEKLKELNDLVK